MIGSNILKITVLAAALALAGCGGGGGYYGDNSSTSTDSSSTSSSINVSSITLTDSSGKIVTTISTSGVTATVTVKNANGSPISGAIVTFSGDNMTFSTTNGSVVTNVDGVATIGITPTDSTVTGAYVLTASASYDGTTNTNTANVMFSKTNIVISNLTLASSALESGGSTLLSLVTNDTDGNYQNGQTVNFTTTCGSFSDASVVSSSEGNISTTYYAYDADGKLCSGTQTITATPTTSTTNAQTASVTIAAATATSIVYTTTDEIKLAIKGSGSSSTGQIEFTIYSNGTALANQDVILSIKNAPRGFSFITDGNTTNKVVKSNSAGKVIVNLYPGNTPGPVEVEATLTSGFSALSKNVTITTGRATQNSFSLSVSKNSLQADIDGDTATITAMLADRNGNSVPDGTVVNFVTEGGKVDGSCSTNDGQCSVTIRTQNPRPADGRVSVLAYVEGDKSYIDKNGNNIYDAGDTLARLIGNTEVNTNIGDFFRDDNENTIYNSAIGEFLYNRGASGEECGDTNVLANLGQPNIAGTCDDQLSAILRRQIVMYFASSTATIPDASASGSLLSFNLYGNSAMTTPMPSGTSVAVTTTDGTNSNNLTCSAELSSGSTPVANIASSTYYAYKLTGCAVGDSFKITATAPNGKISNEYVNYK